MTQSKITAPSQIADSPMPVESAQRPETPPALVAGVTDPDLVLPRYERDDGPLTDAQMEQIRALAPQGGFRSVRSSLRGGREAELDEA